MALKLITPPTIEPVSITDMANYARIDADPDSITLATMITTARVEAEKITRRQLITATWEYVLDFFPSGSQIIYLPMPRLQSVTSVKYLDSSGVEKTLVANTDYLVDADSEPARITPGMGLIWPVTYPVVNTVRIRFVSGYGATKDDVPQSIRNWIMAFAASLYENRETEIVANITQAYTHIQFFDGLLADYRVFGLE